VVDVLAGDFPDLCDPVVAGIIRKHVYIHARTQGVLEVILDDPFTANWRLLGQAGRVSVACWRLNLSDADQERQNRLNAALDALSTTEDA
jgi:hypothetical protein